jgi:hypothetical protein
VLPRYSELGTWKPYSLQCQDTTSNRLEWWSPADFVAHNFPVNLVVIQPSNQIDGSFDSGHPTVIDTASNTVLTDSGGQLTAGTTAAIDVLDSPPTIEPPSGFSIGTGFISVTLSPQPAMPLPPPGLTLTLTLNNQQTPGAGLALYKIGPSNNLVPVPKAGGGFVTGTVDGPLGQTATFTGIAAFSTVVGLNPPTKPGDLNADGVVNCIDIQLIRNSWGKRLGQAEFDATADYNRDGVVNIFDLAAVSKLLPRGTKCW